MTRKPVSAHELPHSVPCHCSPTDSARTLCRCRCRPQTVRFPQRWSGRMGRSSHPQPHGSDRSSSYFQSTSGKTPSAKPHPPCRGMQNSYPLRSGSGARHRRSESYSKPQDRNKNLSYNLCNRQIHAVQNKPNLMHYGRYCCESHDSVYLHLFPCRHRCSWSVQQVPRRWSAHAESQGTTKPKPCRSSQPAHIPSPSCRQCLCCLHDR